MGKQWQQWQILFSWAPKSLQMVTAAMKLKDACSLEESYEQPRQHIKKQRHYFANKGPSSQSCGFSSDHVWMWELDYKESWAPKNWCFWTVVLEKTLESLLDCKEIQTVNYWMLGAGALGRPWGRVWGGRKEEGSGWETGIPVADSFPYLAKLIQYCKV